MTCQECQKLLGKDPRSCTTAERSAVRKHTVSCKECYDFLKKECKEAAKKIPPHLLPFAVLAAHVEKNKLVEMDKKDPEA